MSESKLELTGREVAIVGLSVRMPQAREVAAFWSNLVQGRECITALSDQELLDAGVEKSLLRHPRYVKAAPVLDDVEWFDAAFFGYSPQEAEMMDPQVRLFHECAYEALEDAGYNPEKHRGSIGVYAGAAANLAWEALTAFSGTRDVAELFEAEKLFDRDYLPTRLSFKLNLTGPSVCVSTACSTSLAAVHLACQGLLAGECDMALAGGASVTVPHRVGYLYQPGMVASPDGHCRAFDVDAMGTLRGSGVGVVVLKLLEDALEDRDHIYAVIKASAANNDGKRKVGFTAPSVVGQAQCIRMAIKAAEVDPATITYLEAHGTGTPLGDPVEVAALKSAFGNVEPGTCRIGSVKSNMGHLDAAAGIAGLIKTTLALHHKSIPPTLHVRTPNPKLQLEGSPFTLATALVPWTHVPRRAGVSSFGIGGTNIHVVLEEAPPTEPTPPEPCAQLIPISARTETALNAQCTRLADFLSAHPETPLADAAFTLQTGRKAFPLRRAFVASSTAGLASALSQASTPPTTAREIDPPVIFLFPGQGSQYVGMGADLYAHEPRFKAEFDRCCQLIERLGGEDLRRYVSNRSDSPLLVDSIVQTRVAQPVLFCFEYALAQQLMAWGIKPHAMAGHSLGELVGACLAGMLPLQEAVELVVHRARLMQSMASGSMISVAASEEVVRARLPADLSVAAMNSPTNTVVSGQHEAVERFAANLVEHGIEHVKLHTSHAFHSGMMDEAARQLDAALGARKLQQPTIPLVSNVTGSWFDNTQAVNGLYWAQQLRSPVKFSQCLGTLSSIPDAIFLEVGPGRTLSTLVRQQQWAKPETVALQTIRHVQQQVHDQEYLLQQMGSLWSKGVSIDFGAMHHGKPSRVSLPTYPFERKRFWAQVDGFIARRNKGTLPWEGTDPNQALPVEQWFHAPSWQRHSPLAQRNANVPVKDTTWLVLHDNNDLAGVCHALRQQGARVIQVAQRDSYAQTGEDLYTVRPSNAEDWGTLLQAITPPHTSPACILYGWTLRPADGFSLDDTTLERCFVAPVIIAHALRQRGINTRMVVLTRHTQDVLGTEAADLGSTLVTAPVLVIPQELNTLDCLQVDLDDTDPGSPTVQRALLQDCTSAAHDRIVAYRGGFRWTRTYQPLSPQQRDDALREQGTYLVVGGTGRVGLAFAAHLAQRTRGNIVLVGRAEPGHERVMAALSQLSPLGATCSYHRADLSQPRELRNVVESVLQRHGGIDGVVHAAGAVVPRLLQDLGERDKNIALLRELLEPKTTGLQALHAALENVSTRFRLVTSSLSSVLGGPAYGPYAAANLCLDALVTHLNRNNPNPWTAINWDAWSSEPEEPDEQVAMDHVFALAGAHPRVVASRTPLAPRLATWTRHTVAQEAVKTDSTDTASMAPSPETNTTSTQGHVEQIWRELFGLEHVGMDQDFFEIGGDSLKAITLLSRVEKRFGIAIPLKDFFARATIRGMATFIDGAGLRNKVDDGAVIFNPGKPLTVFCFPPYVCFGLAYHELSKLLPDHALHCFNHHGEDNAVDGFVRQVLEAGSDAPHVLFGYSAGGRIAYAVTRELERRGHAVSDLVLLDAFARWKTLEQYSPEVETARSNKLLDGFRHLFADDTGLKQGAVKRLLSYSRLAHEIVVAEPVKANIHFIRSQGQHPEPDNLDWIEFTLNNTWRHVTANEYVELQGSGEHMDMLFGEHLPRNAQLIQQVLDGIERRRRTGGTT